MIDVIGGQDALFDVQICRILLGLVHLAHLSLVLVRCVPCMVGQGTLVGGNITTFSY